MDFVKFNNKNRTYKGDKGSWAAFDKDEVVVQRSRRGILSSAYEAELRDWCQQYGINWDAISSGDRVRAPQTVYECQN